MKCVDRVCQMSVVALGIVVGLAAAGELPASQSAPSQVSILDGVYTDAQAVKGQDHYRTTCMHCHEGSAGDAPILLGRSFIDRWREDSVAVLYDYIRTRMPPDANITLSNEAYLGIVSHLLHANGYPSGDKELTAESAAHARVVGKEGPRPLGSNTPVRVVGCMIEASPNTWMLSHASEPVRDRKTEATSPEEMKQSTDTPAGTLRFRIASFTNIKGDFQPATVKGHRVQLKGILIRQTNNDRIVATLIESVAPTCAP